MLAQQGLRGGGTALFVLRDGPIAVDGLVLSARELGKNKQTTLHNCYVSGAAEFSVLRGPTSARVPSNQRRSTRSLQCRPGGRAPRSAVHAADLICPAHARARYPVSP